MNADKERKQESHRRVSAVPIGGSISIRVGDIVRTPYSGGLYGDLPAIVTKKAGIAITVHTGHAELQYEAERLRPWGTITLGRAYGADGYRWRVCVYTGLDGATKEVHVMTRRALSGHGETTAALEVRKLAFIELMKLP